MYARKFSNILLLKHSIAFLREFPECYNLFSPHIRKPHYRTPKMKHGKPQTFRGGWGEVDFSPHANTLTSSKFISEKNETAFSPCE